MEDLEAEEEQNEKQGPMLRGSMGSMRNNSSSFAAGLAGGAGLGTSIGGFSMGGAGMGAAGGGPGGAVGAAHTVPPLPHSLSDASASSAGSAGSLSGAAGSLGASLGGLGSGALSSSDAVKSDYEHDKLLQLLQIRENMQRRITYGAAPNVDMVSPWVGPDYTVPPAAPRWPSAVREFIIPPTEASAADKDDGTQIKEEGGETEGASADDVPGAGSVSAASAVVASLAAAAANAAPGDGPAPAAPLASTPSTDPDLQPPPPAAASAEDLAFPLYSRVLSEVVDLAGSR